MLAEHPLCRHDRASMWNIQHSNSLVPGASHTFCFIDEDGRQASTRCRAEKAQPYPGSAESKTLWTTQSQGPAYLPSSSFSLQVELTRPFFNLQKQQKGFHLGTANTSASGNTPSKPDSLHISSTRDFGYVSSSLKKRLPLGKS
ncbi:hypothetical protein HPP92_023301 [Vanilla planifolia]|uniref:Uncharacterized protein n=1 Tax=Vanilla planifolia TaxID=51239 RepID=A0A835Q018_VANPL|nr:hypothetical protein HPP92_023301 [Vanilla planifolia]